MVQRAAADGLGFPMYGREPPMMISSFTVRRRAVRFCERGGGSVRIPPTKAWAGFSTRRWLQSRSSMPGVRALDIRIPIIRPKSAISPLDHGGDRQRCMTVDGKDRCRVAIQTNNVETDERGYYYIVDRANTGLHIRS